MPSFSDVLIGLGTGQNADVIGAQAFTEGRMRSAQTESAVAQARERRAQAMLQERTLAQRQGFKDSAVANGIDPSIVDALDAGYNPEQMTSAMLDTQEFNYRDTLGDPNADPRTQFTAGQAVQGQVLPRFYQPATGMMADKGTLEQTPTITPLGQAQADAYGALGVQRQAAAGAADASASLRNRTDPNAAKTPVPGAAPKPLPVGALKMIDEAEQAMGTADASATLADEALALIENGQVDLGMANNLISRGRNLIGESSPESLAYATVGQTLEKLRNNYLLLAKGVQTEGDAQRAWKSEVGEAAAYDNALAKQQIERATALIDMGRRLQMRRIQTVRENYNPVTPGAAPTQNRAPPQAEAYLRANPQLKDQFQAKYGYLPEGM